MTNNEEKNINIEEETQENVEVEVEIEMPKQDNSFEEDLELINESHYIKDIFPKKPGLDLKNAKYRIVGAVTDSSIYKRKTKNDNKIDTSTKGNLVATIGYKVKELKTGKTKLVTKKQGIGLCRLFGMENAYITCKNYKRKDSEGNVILKVPSSYLQPYPSSGEAFTQDDRIVSIYKLDADCKFIIPIELKVKEEEATEEMWELIQALYNAKSKQRHKTKRLSGNKNSQINYEHMILMNNLRAELKREELENNTNTNNKVDK